MFPQRIIIQVLNTCGVHPCLDHCNRCILCVLESANMGRKIVKVGVTYRRSAKLMLLT